MVTKFNIDGEDYELKDFSAVGQELIKRLVFVTENIQNLRNNAAVLMRAKNGYIEDLKLEAVEGKSGLNIAALFSEDWSKVLHAKN